MQTALPLDHDRLLRLTNAAAARLRNVDPYHELLRFAAPIEHGVKLDGELLKEFMERFGHDTLLEMWRSYLLELEAAATDEPPGLPAQPRPRPMQAGQPALLVISNPNEDSPSVPG